MSKPKLLITGASGLIGQILIPHLTAEFDIYGLDIAPAADNGRIHRADVADAAQVRQAFAACAPLDYVIHLAADPRVDAEWHAVWTNNIPGAWNTFAAAAENDLRRVVFASSNHATGYYEGIPRTLHLQENPPTIAVTDPVRPDGPYGISKITGEAIARYFYDRDGLEAVCLRIGSVLPDDDPSRSDRSRATWLSHRDLRHLVERALLAAETFPGFGIYYGVSANNGRFWEIDNAAAELGYRPQDDAAAL